MKDLSGHSAERVRPLIRVRQIRDYADRPVAPVEIDAIGDVARWSGSSQNTQPWRFIVIRDRAGVQRIADVASRTGALHTATAAIAIILPDDPARSVMHAFDEGRAAERILIAASSLGLGAGITWTRPEVRAAVGEVLGLPAGWMVRTIVAIGHPSEAAHRPKSAPGAARLPRDETVFEDRWPEAGEKAGPSPR
jgi:nitroreductase